MEIRELKEAIKQNTLASSFFIFTYHKDTFLVEQYYRSIYNNSVINYVESLTDIQIPNQGLFDAELVNNYIYKCEELKNLSDSLTRSNLIIITKKVSKEISEKYKDYIVDFPDLEQWQIEDYAYTLGKGIDKESLKKFVLNCNYNIYRIDSELQKLKDFTESQRNYLFNKMDDEGAFDDVSNYNIFDLTNALQAKDYNGICQILRRIGVIDVDPPYLMSVLYQGFRRIIKVWLDKYPTPESTGLKSNQIWAIKNIPHNYSREQLISIFKFLTSLDCDLKNGNLPNVDCLVDYIILKVLLYGDS